MLDGFNVGSTQALAKAIKTPVIASGGIGSLDDIRKLKELEGDGVIGAVIGRALYEDKFKLADAVKIATA